MDNVNKKKTQRKFLTGITGPSQQALRAAEGKSTGYNPGRPRPTAPKASASGNVKPKVVTSLAQQRIDRILHGNKNKGTTETVPCKGVTAPAVRPGMAKARNDERRQSPQPGPSRKPEGTRQASPDRKPAKA